jgi:glutathione peroxidase-family protein
MSGAYDFSARDFKTNDVVQLDQYEGQVALIVNLASA